MDLHVVLFASAQNLNRSNCRARTFCHIMCSLSANPIYAINFSWCWPIWHIFVARALLSYWFGGRWCVKPQLVVYYLQMNGCRQARSWNLDEACNLTSAEMTFCYPLDGIRGKIVIRFEWPTFVRLFLVWRLLDSQIYTFVSANLSKCQHS